MNEFIPIIFDNQTGQKAFVQFLNGHFGIGQTGAGGTQPLSGNMSYSFEQLASLVPGFPILGKVPNVSLNDFTNGRIYLNLGDAGLSGLGSGYQPASANPSDPNYNIRYGFIELNVFGNASNNLDLSYIDFFGISMEASTWKNGKKVGSLTSASGGDIIKALAPLTQGKAVVPLGIPSSPYKDFIRILGPGQNSHYHNWTSYFSFLERSQYQTIISGGFAGVAGGKTPPTQKQTYCLSVSFNSEQKVVTLEGTLSVVGTTKITITYSDLNKSTGVYGANPPYCYVSNGGKKVHEDGIQNDVYGRVIGDLLAGLNFGFPGSSTIIPGTKTVLGEISSSEWFKAAEENSDLEFSGAQENSEFYNDYAGKLLHLTEAYGFPFTDRLGGVLLPFSPSSVDYVTLTLLAD